VIQVCRHVALLVIALLCTGGHAQSLDDRLDVETYLDGLVDLRLDETFDAFVAANPAGDDDVRRALYDITAHRLRLEASGTSSVEALFDAHDALIDGHPDDARRARWRWRRATDRLRHELDRDGTTLALLFGVPSAERRQRAARVLDAVDADVRRLDEALKSLNTAAIDDALGGWYDGPMRDTLLPSLVGTIDVLRGIMQESAVRIRSGIDQLRRSRALDARARLMLARGMIELEDHAGAAHLLDEPGTATDGSRDTRFMLCRAMLIEGLDGLDAMLVYFGAADAWNADRPVFERLLCADLVAVGRLEAVPVHDERTLARVYQPYLDILRDVGDEERRAMRTSVVDRLATLITTELDVDRTPALVSLAIAKRAIATPATRGAGLERLRVIESMDGVSDEDRIDAMLMRAEALRRDGRAGDASTVYLSVAELVRDDARSRSAAGLAVTMAARAASGHDSDSDDEEHLRRTATFLLDRYSDHDLDPMCRLLIARLDRRAGRFDDARRSLDAIARSADEWPPAQVERVRVERDRMRTMSEALRIAEGRRLRRLIDDLRANTRLDGASQQQLDVLDAEIALAMDDADAAIAVTDRILTDDGLSPEVHTASLRIRINAHRLRGDFTSARNALGAFAQRSPEWVPSIVSPMLADMVEQYEQLRRGRRHEEAASFARDELAPLTDIVAGAVSSPGPALTLLLAEAERLGGWYERALARYDALRASAGDAQEVLLGRAECLFHLTLGRDSGDPRLGEAMLLYRRLSAGGEDQLGEDWWLCQLRMLQILDRSGRNVAKIRPRIAALRARDATFGGGRYEAAFLALERRAD